jgi:hypothetical protein
MNLIDVTLNAEQRKALGEMLHHVFLDIRILGWDGKGEQAADLADAIHNLPLILGGDRWDIDWFRGEFQRHQSRFRSRDYVAMLDRVFPRV